MRHTLPCNHQPPGLLIAVTHAANAAGPQRMTPKNILISGGTGMVGTALSQLLLQQGYTVTILTRSMPPAAPPPGVQYALWNVRQQTIDAAAVQQAHALVHLAGAGVVAQRWSPAYKQEIINSRVQSSALLAKAIAEHGQQLSTVVSASAIGWYGADEDGTPPFTEDMPPAPGFLGDTCKLWEDSIQPVVQAGKRLAICRIGIVLSNAGGALPEFQKPLRMRVAGILGSGRQMISWIHIDDLCRMLLYALENDQVQGVYNATAPAPVSNATLTHTLATTLYGKLYLPMPVPAFVLRLLMGEMSIEVLKSTTVSSLKIQQAGFSFRYLVIQSAIKALVAAQGQASS